MFNNQESSNQLMKIQNNLHEDVGFKNHIVIQEMNLVLKKQQSILEVGEPRPNSSSLYPKTPLRNNSYKKSIKDSETNSSSVESIQDSCDEKSWHIRNLFRNPNSIISKTSDDISSIASNDPSVVSEGGQLYKICKQLESQTLERQATKNKHVLEIPCPEGNVANLRSQLSPHLFKNKFPYNSYSSTASTRSKLSRTTTASSCDSSQSYYPYLQEQKAKRDKTLSKVYSDDSSVSEDYEIIENVYENVTFPRNDKFYQNVDVFPSRPQDDDARSDVTYESIDLAKVDFIGNEYGITNNELGYEDSGYSDDIKPVCALNSAYGTTIQELSESTRRKHLRKLRDRVNELIHSESIYIDKLKIVVKDYLPEMEREDLPSDPEFTKDNIFSNIENIYRMHLREFHPLLKKNQRNLKKIAQAFIEYEDTFDMYIEYARNNNRANRIFNENKQFFSTKQSLLKERLNLASHLLEPVQRLPRYVLFLDELIKTYSAFMEDLNDAVSVASSCDNSTSSDEISDDSDKDSVLTCLRTAKESVKNVLKRVDDSITFFHIKDCPLKMEELGKLLRQDEFVVVKDLYYKKPYTMKCFLFEQQLIFTLIDKMSTKGPVYTYHDCIEMSSIGLTPPENIHITKFSVWYKNINTKNYMLESTSKVTIDWVKCISSRMWMDAQIQKELIKTQTEKMRTSISSEKVSVPSPSSTINRNSTSSAPPVPNRRQKSKSAGYLGPNERPSIKLRTTWYVENDD